MIQNELTYLKTLRNVLENGIDRADRTGTGVRSLFGVQTRYDLRNGFPLLTTKKMNLPSILSELLWFIEGSGDERRLAEIRFGKPRSQLVGKQTIWSANANADYWSEKSQYPGDLGRIYGVQWRKWRQPVEQPDGSFIVKEIDQLANLIECLIRNPFGRRHILSAWNPGEIDDMALPPCHVMSQFYVSNGELSCHLYQRSADFFLGSAFNIPSYALLTYMLARVCGLSPGDFVYTIGDCHLYLNHIEAAEEQLSRTPRPQPLLYMEPGVDKIDDFRMNQFEIINYDPLPTIKADMSV